MKPPASSGMFAYALLISGQDVSQRGGHAMMLCGEVAKCREGMVYFYIFLELIRFFIDNLTL